MVRGNRGEIRGTDVRYLQDVTTPVHTTITRVMAGIDGNHEGMFLRGLTVGQCWMYRNEFLPARLNDDELAVAACLSGMNAYVHGGPDLYSLAEASQDHYLQLMIRRAVRTGERGLHPHPTVGAAMTPASATTGHQESAITMRPLKVHMTRTADALTNETWPIAAAMLQFPLRAGTSTPGRHEVGSSVWQVFDGSGSVVLDGSETSLKTGDLFVVPS
jgi:quercetin dioxygenase-like cupin family protein